MITSPVETINLGLHAPAWKSGRRCVEEEGIMRRRFLVAAMSLAILLAGCGAKETMNDNAAMEDSSKAAGSVEESKIDVSTSDLAETAGSVETEESMSAESAEPEGEHGFGDGSSLGDLGTAAMVVPGQEYDSLVDVIMRTMEAEYLTINYTYSQDGVSIVIKMQKDATYETFTMSVDGKELQIGVEVDPVTFESVRGYLTASMGGESVKYMAKLAGSAQTDEMLDISGSFGLDFSDLLEEPEKFEVTYSNGVYTVTDKDTGNGYMTCATKDGYLSQMTIEPENVQSYGDYAGTKPVTMHIDFDLSPVVISFNDGEYEELDEESFGWMMAMTMLGIVMPEDGFDIDADFNLDAFGF